MNNQDAAMQDALRQDALPLIPVKLLGSLRGCCQALKQLVDKSTQGPSGAMLHSVSPTIADPACPAGWLCNTGTTAPAGTAHQKASQW